MKHNFAASQDLHNTVIERSLWGQEALDIGPALAAFTTANAGEPCMGEARVQGQRC